MTQSRFDLILHPARLQLIHIVDRAGHISRHELQRRMPEIEPETLSRYLDMLVEGGVLLAAGEPGDGQRDIQYELVKSHANITDTEVRLATPADHLRYFTTFVAGMIDMYSRYLKQPDVDLVADGVELRQELLYLSHDELRGLVREFQDRLNELARNRPDAERTARVFSWIIMPGVFPGDDPPLAQDRDERQM